MAFNRILDFSNGLDFYLGFFFFIDIFEHQNLLSQRAQPDPAL
jgi:hypothetical protein